MTELDLQLQAKLDALQKEWEANPLQPTPPVVDIGRKAIPIDPDIAASAFDFTEKQGNTTYEVVGHFNPDASENLLQKILRMLRE